MSDPPSSRDPAVFVGFDSAWGGRAKGAIASVAFDGAQFVDFSEPTLAGFDEARACIESLRRPDAPTLVAIDQPTIVPNATGMRAVDRAAGSLLSWMGGGVQPANRGRPFFAPDAGIWRFLSALRATQDPEAARTATDGLYIVEVFPALALASLGDGFFDRLKAPHYNPARRSTFKIEHWRAVVAAAQTESARLGCLALAGWLDRLASCAAPRKADQDRLDAAICLLIAMRWRIGARAESALIGDLETGYIVAPVGGPVMERLREQAWRRSVRVDGALAVLLAQPPREAHRGGARRLKTCAMAPLTPSGPVEIPLSSGCAAKRPMLGNRPLRFERL